MMNVLKKLWQPNGHEHLLTPQQEEAHFDLRYGDLLMGRLWLKAGVWHFAYTDAFRNQTKVQPLVDFPDLDKQYRAEDLWPFFAVRIPSLAQPAVQRAVEASRLDAHNEVEMLRKFGRTTIANPFVLEPSF